MQRRHLLYEWRRFHEDVLREMRGAIIIEAGEVRSVKREIEEILKKYTEDVRALYGERLCEIILYGSYVRGDYREDSDIDIMILVDMDDEEIRRMSETLSNLDFDYHRDYDVLIMPIVVNIHHFNRWVRAHPFYNNVSREGIELYEAEDRNAG